MSLNLIKRSAQSVAGGAAERVIPAADSAMPASFLTYGKTAPLSCPPDTKTFPFRQHMLLNYYAVSHQSAVEPRTVLETCHLISYALPRRVKNLSPDIQATASTRSGQHHRF